MSFVLPLAHNQIFGIVFQAKNIPVFSSNSGKSSLKGDNYLQAVLQASISWQLLEEGLI